MSKFERERKTTSQGVPEAVCFCRNLLTGKAKDFGDSLVGCPTRNTWEHGWKEAFRTRSQKQSRKERSKERGELAITPLTTKGK
jgi:hypothetical protein